MYIYRARSYNATFPGKQGTLSQLFGCKLKDDERLARREGLNLWIREVASRAMSLQAGLRTAPFGHSRRRVMKVINQLKGALFLTCFCSVYIYICIICI